MISLSEYLLLKSASSSPRIGDPEAELRAIVAARWEGNCYLYSPSAVFVLTHNMGLSWTAYQMPSRTPKVTVGPEGPLLINIIAQTIYLSREV